MKRNILTIFALTLALLVTNTGIAQVSAEVKSEAKPAKGAIKWYSFEEAYALNKKKPRKIFVDVYTSWCGWCKKMDAETFANPVISKYMSDNFYCVKLDAERKDTVVLDGQKFINSNPGSSRGTHQLATELLKGRMSYPSYVFLNEKGQKLTVVAGYQPAREFEGILHYYGTDAYLKSTLEEYKATFKGELQ